MFRTLFSIAVLFLLVAKGVNARTPLDLFPTPRGQSLGSAMTAFVDDWSSLSYNPAGLALIEEQTLVLPELTQVAISSDIRSFSGKIQNLDTSGGGAGISSALGELDGEGFGASLSMFTVAWVKKRMGIMINPLHLDTSMRLRSPTLLFSKVNAELIYDGGLSLGYAHPFYDNHFRLGFVLRPFLARGGLSEQYEGPEIAGLEISTLVESMGYGWGVDGDLGFQANTDEIPILGFKLKGMGGLVLQNIFANDYSGTLSGQSQGAPPPLQRRIHTGIAFAIENLGIVRPIISVEFRDFLVETQTILQHLHAAFELRVRPHSWFVAYLRGHYAKGNIGGSVAGKLWKGTLEIGTVAVNLGDGAGVGVDRRTFFAAGAEW